MDMELLQAIDKMLDKKLDKILDKKLEPISTRLDAVQEDIDIIKEDAAVTRNAVNILLDWATVMDATTLREVMRLHSLKDH